MNKKHGKLKNKRHLDDTYPTPQPLCDAIVQRLKADGVLTALLAARCSSVLIEPSAGSGNFVRAMRNAFGDAFIVALDSRDTRAECLKAGATVANQWDFSKWCMLGHFDYVRDFVGNPPYSLAARHIDAALASHASGSRVCFLLRMGFLGSRERIEFFQRNPLERLYPVIPRPSFRLDGQTDSSEYAVFVFNRAHVGPAKLHAPIVWEKTREKIKRVRAT